jgi:hypothetical protein
MKDLIERQAAIDGADEIIKRDTSGNNAVVEAMKAWKAYIGNLPSAEKPFKMPEIYVAEGFDTVADEDGNVGFGVYVPDENQIYVAGDVEGEIRARALLHEICHWVQAMCGRSFDEDEANEFSDIVYDALPSAQPEQRWIPVSEMLPEAPGFVNCTCHSLIDNREDWVVETFYMPHPSGSPYSDWGNIPMLNDGECEVVAWMYRNIPEPYKAESEDKE